MTVQEIKDKLSEFNDNDQVLVVFNGYPIDLEIDNIIKIFAPVLNKKVVYIIPKCL